MEIAELRTFVEKYMTPEVLHKAALTKKEPALKEWMRGGLRGIADVANVDEEAAKIACKEICSSYGTSMPSGLETLISCIYDTNTSKADKDLKIDEMVEKFFSSGGIDALEEFVQAMWKGINKLDLDKAAIVGKKTCVCYEVMMPPGWEMVIDSVYDRNNPDVDKALTIQGIIENVAATMEGDRFYIHRKGNKAEIQMGERKCLCPYVYEYHTVKPSPAQCCCNSPQYEKCYLRLYNLPIKARTIQSVGRGDKRCVAEFEFPEELIKTPEFRFP